MLSDSNKVDLLIAILQNYPKDALKTEFNIAAAFESNLITHYFIKEDISFPKHFENVSVLTQYTFAKAHTVRTTHVCVCLLEKRRKTQKEYLLRKSPIFSKVQIFDAPSVLPHN